MASPTTGDLLLLSVAGLAAGTINGVAGGGTLASFPALLAIGVPALRANITSTVGIWPGYLGGVGGFRSEIRDQPQRAARYAIPAVLGSVAGAILLIVTPSSAFTRIVPYLVLLAAGLFALQPVVSRAIAKRHGDREFPRAAWAGVLVGSLYGGYFGAGLGVILLALLGLTLPDKIVRTNGLRSVLSLAVGAGSVLVFVIHGNVAWADAGVLAGSSLVGGYAGARAARRLPTPVFRLLVVALGLVTGIRLLVG